MVFVIAECGVNWRDLVDADDMIREAAKAGADAVKFQAYQEFPMSHPLHKELNCIRLDEQKVRYLYWRCQQHGIEFMCTPMYPGAVTLLNPYVKRWKVRYADKDNYALIEKCEDTGKEMLISGKNLYCVPEYPPQKAPINKIAGEYCGVSSHYPDTNVVENWTNQGLTYIEVHVRLDKYDPHYCPIDTPVSITMSELAELCRRVK